MKPKPKSKSKAKEHDDLTVEQFVERTSALLEVEKCAEKEASLASIASKSLESVKRTQDRGYCLRSLSCTSVEGGLLGHSLVTLEKKSEDKTLPSHKLHPHDIVALKPNKGDPSCLPVAEGVVYRVKEDAIVLVVEDIQDSDGLDQSLRLEKIANETTYNRLKKTLDRLSKCYQTGSGECWKILDCAFGSGIPSFSNRDAKCKFFNERLDHSQIEAIQHALKAEDLAIIHGPPGTGKTTTVVELVLQEALRGSKVLVTAASNVAVDNLVERIHNANKKLAMVRIGHPARLLPQVLNCCLDSLVLNSDSKQLAGDCRKEIKMINQKLMKLKRHERDVRRQLKSELRQLSKEERVRHQKAIREVIDRSKIVAATLTGTMMHHIDRDAFDLVVVDEAAQAHECATWSAIMKGKRAVLAGDHLQLPPTIISDEASRKGLGKTLFERLHKKHGKTIAKMLTVQYRMNEKIMIWSSKEFYKSKLTAHESVKDHCLRGISSGDAEALDVVLHLVDTTGLELYEKQEDEEASYFNEGEAEAVLKQIEELVGAGVGQKDIGVITPYSAQVTLLKQMLSTEYKEVEVSTVDGFQGREKEAIVITTVRSSESGKVGFLADPRRMNVAVTRARRSCILVCDSETLSNDGFLKRLVDYFIENGEYSFAEC